MCDYCKDILKSCVHYHEQIKCPLKRSLFCMNCHNYGHSINECKVEKDQITLEQLIPTNLILKYNIVSNTPLVKSNIIGSYNSENPIYLEDLIPKYYVRRYKISSATLLNRLDYVDEDLKATLDISDHPKVIRDYLKLCGSMPRKSDRSKDKYKNHLTKFAEKMGYNVQYIQNSSS